ncbi:MAG: hypothetical protein KAS66_03585 [Candidatus Omnitrophica bacterium]|nr:hypothetical protein [Candidatus Omnitrophota bacterium]
MEIELLNIIALMATVVLSIISLYFRSKYKLFKETAREFINIVNTLLDMIEDDKVTEDELKEFSEQVKKFIIKVQHLIEKPK